MFILESLRDKLRGQRDTLGMSNSKSNSCGYMYLSHKGHMGAISIMEDQSVQTLARTLGMSGKVNKA